GSAGEVSIYEKRHLRKHRRLLPLQADEFRAAEQPCRQNKEKRCTTRLTGLADELARGGLGSGEKQVRPWLKLGEANMSRTQQFLGSGAAFVRAPGGCERRTTPGALWSQQVFPDPRWTGPKIL